ncbi:MAG: TetR/AcrR family transcriptional regulator [Pseudomonadota bacterium]
MAKRSTNQRPKILAAAFAVVASAGSAHLTLDAVARKAEVSKGGVLYHFPNKRALLDGMLASLIERYGPAADGSRALAAHIERERAPEPEVSAASLAILAAAAEDPSLLDPAREVYRSLVSSARRQSDDPELAAVLILAVEGLRFLRMLDLWPGDVDPTARMLELAQTIAR